MNKGKTTVKIEGLMVNWKNLYTKAAKTIKHKKSVYPAQPKKKKNPP